MELKFLSGDNLITLENIHPPFYQKGNKENSNHRKTKSYSNISILTTKTDDLIEKIISPEKSHLKKYYNNDSIFETLKSRGLIDNSLEKKINDYKTSVNLKDDTNKNISKLSLLHECRIIQKNNNICDKQINNLHEISEMKNKKIDILESTLNSIINKIGNSNTKNKFNIENNNEDENYKL